MPSQTITFENTVIRAKQSRFLVTGAASWMPDDCTAVFRSGDGYYYLTKNQDVDDHGACGAEAAWSLDDGALTIYGTGDMGDYSSGTQPWSGSLDQIKTVVIGNGVTSIGSSAFEGCGALTGVTIPESVTSVGSGAFRGCSGLTGVDMPNSVTSIGDSAFYECGGLTGVTIPNRVTKIGMDTFSGCISLVSVTIPGSVTEIGGGAFDGCGSLTDVSYGGSRIQWSGISGGGKPSDGLVSYAAYDITFDPNGGAFSGGEPVTAATNKNHTLDVGTMANVPTPALDGFTFDGWFTEAEGGEKLGADTVFAADTTVYAHWTPAEP